MTDDPVRYVENLASLGMFYRKSTMYEGKGKNKRRTTVRYECVLSRRKGYSACPARLVITRSNKDKKFTTIRLHMHNHSTLEAMACSKRYKSVIQTLSERIREFKQVLGVVDDSFLGRASFPSHDDTAESSIQDGDDAQRSDTSSSHMSTGSRNPANSDKSSSTD